MKNEPIVLLVAEMKNIGKRESHWSDDNSEWRESGPDYVRLKARSALEGDKTILTFEVPRKMSDRFRVGGKITLIAGGV